MAAAAALVAFGGIVTVTQVSDASTKASMDKALAACDRVQAPQPKSLSTETKRGTYTTNDGQVTQHADDGDKAPTTEQMRERCREWVKTNAGRGGNNGGNNGGGQPQQPPNNGGQPQQPPNNGLDVIADSCEKSTLPEHTGFQEGDRCVTTQFGEVGTAANNPTLLITSVPRQVRVNQPFTIQVSTRNLIRDRFLGAAAGGYYLETSILQGGLVRGHFHTACRSLRTLASAPANPQDAPEFFVATEDKKGSRRADTVSIQVPGIKTRGTVQCSSWAGDGSHRIPMMERANQTPAFDSKLIRVV